MKILIVVVTKSFKWFKTKIIIILVISQYIFTRQRDPLTHYQSSVYHTKILQIGWGVAKLIKIYRQYVPFYILKIKMKIPQNYNF